MLEIIGYADRFSVAPGETVRFMVSSYKERPFKAEMVRLIHGDANPQGPGFKTAPVRSAIERRYPGRHQTIAAGSYAEIPPATALESLDSFTVAAMIWPTRPERVGQAVVALGHDWRLELCGADGLRAVLGDTSIATGKPLHPRHWYLAALSFDAATGELRLVQEPLLAYPGHPDRGQATGRAAAPSGTGKGPLLMAARLEGDAVTGHFDGKIDGPKIVNRVLSEPELAALFRRPLPPALAPAIVVDLDFGMGFETTRVTDRGPHRLDGRLVNLPTRAMKGWNWDGSEHCYWRKPEHYGAIHFHATDLYDAGWEESFAYEVPSDLPSGVYAAHVACGEAEDGTEEDYIPFFVRPPRGAKGKKDRPKLAFLAPTCAYMAYANDRNGLEAEGAELVTGRVLTYQPSDLFLHAHKELGKSLYDHHDDGAGVAHSSRLRPILNMRPKYSSWLGNSGSGLWQFNADTHILDWLECHAKEPFDVITDEDLHEEGPALLEPYRCVVTGTHPEYHSTAMWDATDTYLNRGGRLMYLAANGWYWRIAFHRSLRGVIEVRRGEDGIRSWEADHGEYWQSFNGEYGGLWQRLGRPPQRLLGIGFMAQGFDVSSHYLRAPGADDPRAAWAFEGVDDEIIGDFGLVGGGAAGLELDAISAKRGTPPHTVVLASSEAHSDLVMLVNEEFGVVPPHLKGSEHPDVRADMVFLEKPLGGAVFSPGSIAWAGSLSFNGYDNNVSRITLNVLRRFLDPTPFDGEPS